MVYAPTVLFSLGDGAVIPLIPVIATRLGADVSLAALVAAALVIGQLCGNLPAGALVAKVGERFTMVVAGARAGVYDLRTMAFETTESMVRAGEWSLRFRSRALVPSPRVAIHSEFLCLVVLPPIPSLPLTRHPTDQPTRLILHPSGCTLILSYFTPQFLDWLDE